MVSNRPTQSNPIHAPPIDRHLLVVRWLETLVVMLVVVAGVLIAELIAPLVIPYLQLTLSGDKPRVFWYLGRSSAFVAYGLLWLAMVFGLLLTNKLARMWPGGPSALDTHQYASLLGLGSAIFHAFILMGSRFLHYDVSDVLIPFKSDAYRTGWVGLGQLSLYGMAILVGSFYVRRKITQRVWRVIHYLSFAVFVMVTAHGLQAGSDSGSPLIQGLYAASAISIVFLIMCRVAYQLVLKSTKMATSPAPASQDIHLQLKQVPSSLPVTRSPAPPGASSSPHSNQASQTQQAMAVVFGSQSGNAESLAKRTAGTLNKSGANVPVIDAARFDVAKLSGLRQFILITSTYGDGEPPDNIAAFYQQLHAQDAPKLPNLQYCVLALGDHGYDTFCKAGQDFDARLAALGARRLCPLATCDTDYEANFTSWLSQVSQAIGSVSSAAAPAVQPACAPASPRIVPKVAPPPPGLRPILAPTNAHHENTNQAGSHAKPELFMAQVLRNVNLHSDEAERQTRQIVFSLRGSNLKYEAGDALGVMPVNRLELVSEMLRVTGFSGHAPVLLPDGTPITLFDALSEHYDITKLTTAHLALFAERTGDAGLRSMLRPENAEMLKAYLHGRELIDLIKGNFNIFDTASDLVSVLRKLNPRTYSISSSQKMHPDEVHLTVGLVSYQSYGRRRLGVCSGDLARSTSRTTRRIFVHPSKSFRLPADPDTPIIMVGPGTGIAPFRGFLQERQATGAKGRNWLFFGCWSAREDFLYRDELKDFRGRDVLTRLDVAFSREQAQKVYVQHLIENNAAEVWRWMEQGAHFYVCGDASRMAKDVEAALHGVAMRNGGLSKDKADEWVQTLRQQKRYLRDVY